MSATRSRIERATSPRRSNAMRCAPSWLPRWSRSRCPSARSSGGTISRAKRSGRSRAPWESANRAFRKSMPRPYSTFGNGCASSEELTRLPSARVEFQGYESISTSRHYRYFRGSCDGRGDESGTDRVTGADARAARVGLGAAVRQFRNQRLAEPLRHDRTSRRRGILSIYNRGSNRSHQLGEYRQLAERSNPSEPVMVRRERTFDRCRLLGAAKQFAFAAVGVGRISRALHRFLAGAHSLRDQDAFRAAVRRRGEQDHRRGWRLAR